MTAKRCAVYKENCVDWDEYQEDYIPFVKIEKERRKRKQRKKGKRLKEKISH